MQDLREENLKRQLRELQKQEGNWPEQMRKMRQREENSQRQLREMQQREENSQRQLWEMQEREENSQRQLREMQEREENSQRQLREIQQREENSQRQLREMQQREENSQRQLREMQQREGNSQRQLREMQQREENSQRQLREMQQREENSQRQLREMQQREENSQRQLREMQQREENSQRQYCDWIIARREIQMTDKCLGRGGWGSVYEGVYCGWAVAVKQIHDLILSPHNIRLFNREMEIASKCHHPHLLQFIGATNDEESPLFVTELMENNLRTLLEQRQLSEREIQTISLDVARGPNYLHHKKPVPIIHRDISSVNVLLWRQGDQWRGKVSDYGTANRT
ncbi:unnamed protein product [Porites lobata]|uniref:Protein kinase domain-containing protein n=1 Tax=Porites lobata TaxID=104759 RepID=A0ABN8S2M6_9CNID|nr:unnamed protein product [Porites lobata]